MKAVVAAFNQEKALVGAFSVITNLRMELFQALVNTGMGDITDHNLYTMDTTEEYQNTTVSDKVYRSLHYISLACSMYI